MIKCIFDFFKKYDIKVLRVYKGEQVYFELFEDDIVDVVFIVIFWCWYILQAVVVMQAGKYVGMEVSGVFFIDECW